MTPADPPTIHPSAIVSRSARLADGVRVGPFVVIEAGVVVGDQTVLLAGTILQRGTRIGAHCRLGPYAIVGGEPMDSKFRGEASFVVIEDRVALRDFVTVHRATGEGNGTRIGRDTLVMSYAHVAHNVTIGQQCVLTTNVQLGGHTIVGDYAVLGSTALVHQFCRIGTYAMLSGASATSQDILPFSMAQGTPARHFRLNRVGLLRHGISGERYRALEEAVRALRRRDLTAFDQLAEANDDVRMIREFRESSVRGVARFATSGSGGRA